ncbi:hypothetical protein C2845_PM01G15430 [Panicum miliaceum]|uniref:diphthine methyl ester synthase n=1 Tax=Panicum miliaceum TaxID=4540 RepID=A0A3L6THC0_PANMI|nr:hypothetical protein C2845_PM01G15430 [Panicum miliaceum]
MEARGETVEFTAADDSDRRCRGGELATAPPRRQMLYIVGLGLGGERGITVRGLDAVRRCARVYMEARTALLTLGVGGDPSSRLTKLENLCGNEVTVAGREIVEEESGDQILREATGADIAFLVVGHPFGSDEPSSKATHTDLVVRAKNMGIEVKVIDSASVLNAVVACGLELHRYGEALTIPFFTETCRRDHFNQAIVNNRWLGLHTLCLLHSPCFSLFDFFSSVDIYAKEPIPESLIRGLRRGNKVYEPPRFMTANTAISQLLEVLEMRGEPEPAYDEHSLCIGVARLGSDDEKIVAGPMRKLVDVDFGPPPHCLVIVGETTKVEEEMLEFYMIRS